tara:strand:- start:686 stop:1030 length:345 start_codon:yes stop_codon:yes gene_type:complete
MIGAIVTSVANLATSVIDGKTAVKKAEAETKMKIATGEISWEQSAIEASKDSWKDEAWTVAFIAIVIGSFIPGLQPYMSEGFANLEKAPSWFQWAMYASIAASFGIRTMKGFKK